jgi:hypothetical protein
MSERSIFLNALDKEDPAARAAYLDVACAGRPELRQRIERLLQAHQTEDTFLEVPAMEQLAKDDKALTFLAAPREPGALGLQQPHQPPPPAAAEVRSSKHESATSSPVATAPPWRRRLVAACLVGVLLALVALAAYLKWRQARVLGGELGEATHQDGSRPASLELRREEIPPDLLALAGGGDVPLAPPELAAVLGISRPEVSSACETWGGAAVPVACCGSQGNRGGFLRCFPERQSTRKWRRR